MAYITDKDGLYELYLAQEGGIIATSDSKSLFCRYPNVTTMNLNYFNTSNVVRMGCMFEYNNKLIELDLTRFDTCAVFKMKDVFYG